jgi:hypothetical protein
MVENANGVLCHKESWLDVRNNSEGFAPHPSFIVNAFLFSCMTHGLARHASTDEVNPPLVGRAGRKCSHVPPPLNVRPMLGEHPAGIVVDFDLPSALHAGPLKAEVEAADAGEK